MNVKKIIAREGLILLAIVVIDTLVLICRGDSIKLYGDRTLGDIWLVQFLFLAVPYYVINLIVRFIVWAIKTLRVK